MNNPDLIQLLNNYRKQQKCLIGFNVNDIYDLKAVALAAEEANCPVMAMTYPPVVELNSSLLCKKMVEGIQPYTKQPIYLHLDHSVSVDMCKQAIDDGYDSVMIDGSQKSLKENIAMTKEVVKYAESAGVLVEAEIGKIMGRDVVVKSDADFLASVDDVKAIVEEANPHIMAVGIGTSHGFTPTTPQIHFDRLSEIAEAVSVPLVLHGGTGIPDEDIQKSITMGVAKLNVGTIVHTTYMKELYNEISKDINGAYPPYLMKDVIPRIKNVVLDRLNAVNLELQY
ncbi:6-phospho-5-dehydro-2-deoxy-D-gluconate aldolase/tagatose 1,6-diphosphate aldolase GatY/KbaY [Lutibacter oricola]|uniref:6-phospho-5-dehydro-2-deoxy-D-gluconate aldolase/tagatose 1,6-diphosphate aldolase GatY/KbaY n=1 Tax=Lutibacter oricola TaxID=762486 RepID=A0A1H2W5T3_9FLAO|nr:class II fructose-bisphosphate aldolase [Lutibacter oricola]SDW75875.1 6-phospho-5-dehydro-2-deoxy-D-gluconate aldolase/tagatose 1,6-diphosphate aldolase GatY/KbaY [Lutibacter oricola]